MLPEIKIKRAYEAASEEDGYRVLVDRLWPRGITKAALHIDEWAKAMAPSGDLRKWYGHQPEKWMAFRKCYLKELHDNDAFNEFIAAHKRYPVITLVYAAKDVKHSNAKVLQECLAEAFK